MSMNGMMSVKSAALHFFEISRTFPCFSSEPRLPSLKCFTNRRGARTAAEATVAERGIHWGPVECNRDTTRLGFAQSDRCPAINVLLCDVVVAPAQKTYRPTSVSPSFKCRPDVSFQLHFTVCRLYANLLQRRSRAVRFCLPVSPGSSCLSPFLLGNSLSVTCG